MKSISCYIRIPRREDTRFSNNSILYLYVALIPGIASRMIGRNKGPKRYFILNRSKNSSGKNKFIQSKINRLLVCSRRRSF